MCGSSDHGLLRMCHCGAAQFGLLCFSSPSGEKKDMSGLLPPLGSSTMIVLASAGFSPSAAIISPG